MDKKGQGLPMNTVVMAILVIVVLILVLTFFFGGFTGLSMKIKNIFYGSLAGSSETLAIQNCNQYCTQLQLRSGLLDSTGKIIIPNKIKNLAFCKKMPIDENEDGVADIKKDCNALNVDCVYEGVKVNCPGESHTENIEEKVPPEESNL